MGFWNSFLNVRSALCATICVVSTAACSSPGLRSEAPEPSERLPEIRLLGAKRRPTTVAELRRGRPALISLWATWCDSCTREVDSLNRLQQRLGDTALVLGIAEGEAYDHVTDFVDRMGITYPQLIDEQFSFSEAVGTRSLPSVLIADREGLLRHRGGELDREALDALRVVLAAPSREPAQRLAAAR
jgi:peroxiredoxin